MASNYDVTMKQYNGTDYDKLYPKDISQQVLLNDNTVAQYIALTTPNPTILDAISQLQDNIYFWGVHCQIVSYDGTGVGTASPSITFSFAPDLVLWIGAASYNAETGIYSNAVPMLSGYTSQIIMFPFMISHTSGNSLTNAGFQRKTSSSTQSWTGSLSENGTKLSWTCDTGDESVASSGLNAAGVRYHFLGMKFGSES